MDTIIYFIVQSQKCINMYMTAIDQFTESNTILVREICFKCLIIYISIAIF